MSALREALAGVMQKNSASAEPAPRARAESQATPNADRPKDKVPASLQKSVEPSMGAEVSPDVLREILNGDASKK
jgi:hypothetical protein